MSTRVLTLCSILIVAVAEIMFPGIDRTMSEGIKSLGYKVVYADEDMTVLNEIVEDYEKSNTLKAKINLNDEIKPLAAEDVKCLMSVDRYCTKEMGKMKGVLIQALKEDCVKCSNEQKEEAGKVIAAMMAHDPVAWKLFLTRTAVQSKPPKKHRKKEKIKFKIVGDPETVENSRNRFAFPGVSVRVKRYKMEMIA